MPRIRVSSLFPVDLAGARVAELADALDLGSSVFDVWVRVPSRAPEFSLGSCWKVEYYSCLDER